MPRSKPIGEYRSKSSAIIDMFSNQKKSVRDIAAFVDQTEANVNATISVERTRRRRKDMSPWQREKAMRILPQVFDVVAEALGTRQSALIQFIKHTTFPSAAAPPSAADVDDTSLEAVDEPSSADVMASNQPAGEGQFQSDALSPSSASAVGGRSDRDQEPADHPIPEPEINVLQMKPATQATWDEKISTGLVTLRHPSTGKYLNLDGSGYTDQRQHAYRGTAAQARTMRNKNPLAKGMSFRTFSTPRT